MWGWPFLFFSIWVIELYINTDSFLFVRLIECSYSICSAREYRITCELPHFMCVHYTYKFEYLVNLIRLNRIECKCNICPLFIFFYVCLSVRQSSKYQNSHRSQSLTAIGGNCNDAMSCYGFFSSSSFE